MINLIQIDTIVWYKNVLNFNYLDESDQSEDSDFMTLIFLNHTLSVPYL